MHSSHQPDSLRIWVFSNTPKLTARLQADGLLTDSQPAKNIIGVQSFQLPNWLLRSIKVSADPRTHGKLSSEANFVRFLFAELLPTVDRLLYLDVDIIVQDDVQAVYSTPLSRGAVLGAVKRPIPLRHFLKSSVIGLYERRYGSTINLEEPSFNAGVLLLDLAEWRACNATDELRFWMEENLKSTLWDLGTQPPILLLSYNRWSALETRWNVDGVGYRSDLASLEISRAAILHWTGSHKPWNEGTPWNELWRAYQK